MLKKCLCVIFALVVVALVSVYNGKPLFYEMNKNYLLYTADNSSLAFQTVSDKPFYPFMAKVKGESCKVEKSGFNVDDFFKGYGAEILFVESVDGVISYYGYSKDIKFLTKIKGELINLHVAVAENGVTIGSPIIFGSF